MARSAGIDSALLAAAGIALVCFPATMLPLPGPANACFAILTAWSLYALVRDGRSTLQGWQRTVRGCWPVMLAMSALPLALAVHELAAHRLPDIPYTYLRFALFVLLAWGLIELGVERVRHMQWGFVVGAIVSAVWIHFAAAVTRPAHVGLANVITFGNLSLLMGMLALLSLGWTARRGWFDGGLKVLAGAGGIYTSLMSGTRGGWAAIPLLGLIVVAASRRLRLRQKVALLIGAVAVLVLVGFLSTSVQQRIVETLAGFQQSGLAVVPDSSFGVRLQLWQASITMFLSHPFTGIGPDSFSDALQALAAQGLVSPTAATLTHSHNDVLYAAATLGIFGLAAVVALYLVPGWFFLRHLRDVDRDVRIASASGLATCTGFFVFGLTEAMFVITLTNAFYSLVMAACFAIVVGRLRPRGACGDAGGNRAR